MNDRISTKAGIFESGEKDVYGVQYKDGRLIACRNNKLEDYTVADGTEVICDRAFMNLKELKKVTLPSSIKAIGESAFSGCKSLSEINIPDGVTEIRQATFRDCDELTALELPASVSEIDQFAFGSGFKTLVVNATEMAIDKYALLKSPDFSMLMVPAGTAEYYRGLLFDCRVKATVEEMEDKTEEPASLLGTFLDDHEEVTEGTTNILEPNDIEEKKNMKTVTVEVFGEELFLEPKDPDEEEVYDAYSRFKRNRMVFTVDGSEYGPIDLGIDYNVLTQEQIDEFKDFDVAKFFEESGAKEGMLYTNKAWTTIEIEMPEDEEFKANKACLVTKKFLYPDGNFDVTVCAFGYNGKLYDCAPGDSDGISCEKIWPEGESEEEEEDDWEGWDDDDDLLDDDEDEGKTIEKKSSILKLSGKGVIIEGYGENGHYRGVFKSDFKVTLNGEDVTDRVTYWEAASAFLVNSLINEDVGDGAYMEFNISTEIDLPESVFILPENADIESIELIPVCKDFREPYDEGIVADFIIYDGNVREADSFNNENGLLSKIVYKGQDYDCNQDIYMDYNDPEIELKLYPW